MDLKRLLVPSLPVLLGLALLVLCALPPFGSALVSGDGDLALHLVLGREVLAHGALPASEPTSLLGRDLPFVAHEWGSEVLLAAAHARLGLAGPALLAGLLVGGTLGGLALALRREGVGAWPALLALAGTLLTVRLHLLARPHLATWALALLLLLLLEQHRRGRVRTRALLPLGALGAAVWANLHGGFLVAFVLVGLYGGGTAIEAAHAGERRPAALGRLRALVALALVALAASALNPYGWGLHGHLVGFLLTPALAATREFRPLDLTDPAQATAAVWLLALAAVVLLQRRRFGACDGVLAAGLLLLAARSGRHAALAALLLAPLAGRALQGLLEDVARGAGGAARFASAVLRSSQRVDEPDAARGGAASAALLASALALAHLLGVAPPVRFDPARLPVAALATVQQDLARFEGPCLNDYAWGGLVAYALYPERLAYVNGFNDHYGAERLAEARALLERRDGWEAILVARDLRWALLPSGGPLSVALAARPEWAVVYADPLATLLARERVVPAGDDASGRLR